MRALGMIETMGLIPSIEALDAMLKAANVETLEKTNVRGGIVTVLVVGDVAAVKAAVDAGAAAVQRVSQGALISQHVIPRPDSQIDVLFKHNKKMLNNIEIADEVEKPENVEPENIEDETPDKNTMESEEVIALNTSVEPEEVVAMDTRVEPEKVAAMDTRVESEEVVALNTSVESEEVTVLKTRAELELFLEEKGIEKLMQVINNMRSSELKELAKEYKNGELQEDKNIRSTKTELINRLYDFYSKVVNE